MKTKHHRKDPNKKMTQYHFCDIPANNVNSEPNEEETADKPKVSDILQNDWPSSEGL
jgi:hypothetical protein